MVVDGYTHRYVRACPRRKYKPARSPHNEIARLPENHQVIGSLQTMPGWHRRFSISSRLKNPRAGNKSSAFAACADESRNDSPAIVVNTDGR
jgi:hypothetical protein